MIQISLHDVSPMWKKEVDDVLRMTHAHGIKPSLLVVPNFHGQAPLENDRAFVDELHRLAEAGHEVILHGYFHRAETSSDVFRQRVVSGGEAEFFSLSRDEALSRLDRGLKLFVELGFHTRAFIAPAWSFRPWLLPALQERGLHYTEDHFFTYAEGNGAKGTFKRRPSLLLNYATRTHERLFTTTVFNRAVAPLVQRVPSRIAIHPKDMHFVLLRRELDRLLERAAMHAG